MNAATADGGLVQKKEFQIATWNVNSLRVRGEQVLEWLRAHSPDVVALQETKMQDPNFPHPEFTAAGYHSVFSGQKTYNGVALLSRHPMTGFVRDIPDFDDPPRRVLAADAFAAFEEQGVFDRNVAQRFLDAILSAGGSRKALDAFVEFRGRPPDVNALLRQLGLAQ